MIDSSKVVGQIVEGLYRTLEAFRVENDALRMMLLEKGVTKQAIRRGIREYRKSWRIREDASQTLAKACQGIQQNLKYLDPEALLATFPPKGKSN